MDRSSSSKPISRRTLAALALLGMAPWAPGHGAWAALAEPAAKPVLTITGKIKVSNQGGAAVFDIAMLESLGLASFQTFTPWYSAMVRFEGVLMSRLLDVVGAFGDRVTALALNDYSTEIPRDDFSRFGAILALKRDGEYMPVRDKGPLFIVYPYDSDPELKSQKYYSRSAWQVARLNVA